MNRAKIEQAIIRTIKECGLHAITSTSLNKETLIDNLPALWFAPLKLLEIQGQYSGRIEYKLEMALIYDCEAQSDIEKIVTTDEMEQKLLGLLTILNKSDSIVSIYDTTIEVGKYNPSRVGNLTLFASSKITSYFQE